MGGQQDGLPKCPSHAEPYRGPVRIAARGPWDSAVPRCPRCLLPSEELSGQGLPGAAFRGRPLHIQDSCCCVVSRPQGAGSSEYCPAPWSPSEGRILPWMESLVGLHSGLQSRPSLRLLPPPPLAAPHHSLAFVYVACWPPRCTHPALGAQPWHFRCPWSNTVWEASLTFHQPTRPRWELMLEPCTTLRDPQRRLGVTPPGTEFPEGRATWGQLQSHSSPESRARRSRPEVLVGE